MSHLSLVVALCVVIFSTVHAEPRDVHVQCLKAGFSGACIERPSHGIYPYRCSNLMCAGALATRYYVAWSIGRAVDGTYCGSNRECFDGQCIEVPSEILTKSHGVGAQYICFGMPGMVANAYDQSGNDYDTSHDD